MDPTALPPLDVVGPDGTPVTVRALGPDVTVGELAKRLDVAALWTSRLLDPAEPLSDVDDLRIGARLHASDPDLRARASTSGNDRLVAVVSGPSVTTWRRLGVGRHLIGRAPLATVRLEDPSVELHHALLEITDDGEALVTQLSGAVPIRVGGVPWEGVVDGAGETHIAMGASVIGIRRAGTTDALSTAAVSTDAVSSEPVGSIAGHPSDPWRREVRRAPYEVPVWSASTLAAPVPPDVPRRPSSTGLIGTAVTAGGAVVIATVMENAMFLLFAAVGVVAAVATFVVGVVSTRRRRTQRRARHLEALARFQDGVDALHDRRRDHHRSVHPTVAETIDEAINGGARLWQRRLDRCPDAAMSGVIGTGTHRWNPPIEIPDGGGLDGELLGRLDACARLRDVAAPVTVVPGDAIAFHGPRAAARSIARSVVVQFATWVGPADWQLVVISRDPAPWRWTDWLPHGALAHGSLVVLDADPGPAGPDALGAALDSIDPTRRTIVVTDEPEAYAVRTGPLRRFTTASSATSFVVVDTDATVPAVCRRVLTVGATGSATWSGEFVEADDAVAMSFAGVSVGTADRVARRLACLVDPEDDGGAGGALASVVSFGELLPDTTAETIARRWVDGGSDPAPAAPLGTSADGRVDIDLVRDGPHGLIAGTTGAGKSELLRSLVVGLAASVGPHHLNFVLVDYKGGATFDACTELPHTVGLVTDLDDGLAERALVSLDAELHRRERLLRAVGASDLTDYRARCVGGESDDEPIPRLVVVIDEFATLAKELPDFLSALVGIAQRGRSLGVHLLLATQRPAGVVNDDIRANTNLRMALRLHDRADALDVVGDALPATFPRSVAGRCALRLGPDELLVFQAARCTGPVPTGSESDRIVVEHAGNRSAADDRPAESSDADTELAVAVQAVIAAAARLELAAPRRPWVEPLPFPLHAADDGSIGWVDDPARQGRFPLAWRPSDGSLALIGSVGSGTTSTLIALVAATLAGADPDEVHLYVVDARGDDGLAALASLAHCGGVIGRNDGERLHRLLVRIVAAIDRRIDCSSDSAAADPTMIVMIDGYSALRSSLRAVERQATSDLLQRVVHEASAAGIALVIADDGASAGANPPMAQRWLFHLDDPSDARELGLRTAPVPADMPGRLRVLPSGLEAQVARGAPGLAALPSRGDRGAGGPPPIAVLPDTVGIDAVGAPAQPCDTAPGRSRLLVGLDADDLDAAHLELVDGDHVLVAGGPRTGVSTALERVAAAWTVAAERRGEPFRVRRCDRRTPLEALDTMVADRRVRTAIVIDDAHRVEGPDVLASIAWGECPHITLLAGGRADAIRAAYGHWTRDVAKSRCGIVMASRSDPDGDLLAAQIPRRSLVAARPGLAWIVDGGPLRQAQIALETSARSR